MGDVDKVLVRKYKRKGDKLTNDIKSLLTITLLFYKFFYEPEPPFMHVTDCC
jgi:hypothetical protein